MYAGSTNMHTGGVERGVASIKMVRFGGELVRL